MTKEYCKFCKKENHCCIFKSCKGFVFVGINDAKMIKRFIKKEFSDFLDFSKLPKKVINSLKKEDPSLEGYLRYTQLVDDKILRLKTQKNGKCIFLHNACKIYKARPNICRMFPYWGIRLVNNQINIIPHDENHNCNYLKKTSSIKNIDELKNVFKSIELENKNYKKNIKKFSHLL